MSLRELRSALAGADLKPHTHTSSIPEPAYIFPFLSGNVLTFLNDLSEESPFHLLSNDAWSHHVMRRYRSLDVEERLEVLGALSFDPHELTHRIDMLISPFGASFHMRSCLETISLLIDGPEIVLDLAKSAPHLPLRDLPRDDDLAVGAGRPALLARIAWFDTLRGSSPHHISRGSNGSEKPIYILGKVHSLVTVQKLLLTVELPNHPNLYLRPQTILESRAVAVSALKLLGQLGNTKFAVEEVRRFIVAFYGPGHAHPEYGFLYDIFSSVFDPGATSRNDGENSAGNFATMLRLMVIVGWYALHTTFSASVYDQDVSPVLRLFAAIQAYQKFLLEDGTSGRTSAGDFLEAIDSGDAGIDWKARSIYDKLSIFADTIHSVRDENRRTNPHDELAAHFEQLLNLNEYYMRARLASELGYTSLLGIPDTGDLLAGIGTIEPDKQSTIWQDAEPPENVRRWFQLRETLLFHQARPAGIWDQYREYACGLRLPAREIDRRPEEVRQAAAARARVTAGSVWFQGDNRLPQDRVVCCLLPSGRLPRSFERSNADISDDIQTRWSTFQTIGDIWVTLDIDFPEVNESVRLLFSVVRHGPYLHAILQSQFIGLSLEPSEDDSVTVIGVPVTSDPTMVEMMLSAPVEQEFVEDDRGWSLRLLRKEEVALQWRVEARQGLSEEALELSSHLLEHRDGVPNIASFTISLSDSMQGLVVCGEPKEVSKFWAIQDPRGSYPKLRISRVAARDVIGKASESVRQARSTEQSADRE
jgi:hypothetical protein